MGTQMEQEPSGLRKGKLSKGYHLERRKEDLLGESGWKIT